MVKSPRAEAEKALFMNENGNICCWRKYMRPTHILRVESTDVCIEMCIERVTLAGNESCEWTRVARRYVLRCNQGQVWKVRRIIGFPAGWYHHLSTDYLRNRQGENVGYFTIPPLAISSSINRFLGLDVLKIISSTVSFSMMFQMVLGWWENDPDSSALKQ